MSACYFLTWTTYGTSLPGDERGWVGGSESGVEVPIRAPDDRACQWAQVRMRDKAVRLSTQQRALVGEVIREVGQHKAWSVHALNVRTNHVHVVVYCESAKPETVMSQLKAWCSRRLNELAGQDLGVAPRRWWTRHGSTRYLNSERAVDRAVRYVIEQ